MDPSKRLTQVRVNGIKSGYWTAHKKDELTQRLGEYEDTGLAPEEIKALDKTGNTDSAQFDLFLKDLKEALDTEVRHGMRSYTSKLCFIAEVLTITADNPIKELTFTAGEIKRALNLAKEKNA